MVKKSLHLLKVCIIISFVVETANFYGPLAHLVEHLTLNQGVRGSSPRRSTMKVLIWQTLSCWVGAFSFLYGF